MQKNYTVKLKFMTARKGSGASISGTCGNAEVDITANGDLDTSDIKDPVIIEGCKQVLYENKAMKNKLILSVEILEIIEL